MGILKGQTAVVTGASRGIGKAIANELALHGAKVVVNYHESESEGLETIKEFKATGYDVELFHADISDAPQVASMMDFARKTFGPVNILVNNAGIIRDRTIKNLTLEDWKRVIDVNLTGAFICTKLAADQMMEKKYGRIVNISSVVARTGNFGQANYCASKSGLIGLTMTSALEYAKYGITVNAVAPGFIRTRMTESMPKDALDNAISRIPLKKLGETEDVSKVVLFLASESSRFITGQIINVNGGLFMS